MQVWVAIWMLLLSGAGVGCYLDAHLNGAGVGCYLDVPLSGAGVGCLLFGCSF